MLLPIFSLPWRPLIATRTITPKVPYRGALKLDNGTMLMHPETLRKLRDQLQMVER